jgi:hypothetical protein
MHRIVGRLRTAGTECVSRASATRPSLQLRLVRHGTSGNVKKATAVVTRCGCRRGEFFEGSVRRGEAPVTRRAARVARRGTRARNAANPRTGSGMQQARSSVAEQAVEVVRNHVDGTWRSDGSECPKGGFGRTGVDAAVYVGGGADPDESQERKVFHRGFGQGRAPASSCEL